MEKVTNFRKTYFLFPLTEQIFKFIQVCRRRYPEVETKDELVRNNIHLQKSERIVRLKFSLNIIEIQYVLCEGLVPFPNQKMP